MSKITVGELKRLFTDVPESATFSFRKFAVDGGYKDYDLWNAEIVKRLPEDGGPTILEVRFYF